VSGAFKILHGSGEYLLKYAKELSDPTFEEARSPLRATTSLFKFAPEPLILSIIKIEFAEKLQRFYQHTPHN
jgi:hypothetical protein